MGPNPTRTGVLVGLPSPWRAPCWPACSFTPLYTGAGCTPKAQQTISQPCAVPPSTILHLGHIVVVLRRSPALVTSSSPSQCRRADKTLPRPQLDLEFVGRHRAERVQIAEVLCIRYLIGWIAKTFEYINRITKRFHFWSTRVRGHTLPARYYASPR